MSIEKYRNTHLNTEMSNLIVNFIELVWSFQLYIYYVSDIGFSLYWFQHGQIEQKTKKPQRLFQI